MDLVSVMLLIWVYLHLLWGLRGLPNTNPSNSLASEDFFSNLYDSIIGILHLAWAQYHHEKITDKFITCQVRQL